MSNMPPNPRLQRTRFAPLRSPLSRKLFGEWAMILALVLFSGCSHGSVAGSATRSAASQVPDLGSDVGSARSELVFTQDWGFMGGSGFELTVCPGGGATLHRLSSDNQLGEWYTARMAEGTFSSLRALVDALRGPGEFRVCADVPDFYIHVRQPFLDLRECSLKIEDSRFGPVYRSVGMVISGAAWQRLPTGKPPKPCELSTASPLE